MCLNPKSQGALRGVIRGGGERQRRGARVGVASWLVPARDGGASVQGGAGREGGRVQQAVPWMRAGGAGRRCPWCGGRGARDIWADSMVLRHPAQERCPESSWAAGPWSRGRSERDHLRSLKRRPCFLQNLGGLLCVCERGASPRSPPHCGHHPGSRPLSRHPQVCVQLRGLTCVSVCSPVASQRPLRSLS